MKILKINPNKPEKGFLKLAAHILSEDGLVVFPTDTLYGIACNALSKKAIIKVYKAKGRGFKKPLSIACHSIAQAEKYAKFDSISLKLAKKFLPGPLTIVLPMKYKFPKELTSGSEKVGIRIPDNRVALELIEEFGYPITATSANISGNKDPVTGDDAMKQIGDKVDLILDVGKCKLNKPSTVIDVVNNKICVIRKGVITEKMVAL